MQPRQGAIALIGRKPLNYRLTLRWGRFRWPAEYLSFDLSACQSCLRALDD